MKNVTIEQILTTLEDNTGSHYDNVDLILAAQAIHALLVPEFKPLEQFQIGDKVTKPKGYSFDGIVVAIFETTKKDVRIVVELEGNGMLHIFSPSQLTLRE